MAPRPALWLVGTAGAIAIATFVVWLVASYLYGESENRNFEQLRRKSELDCSAIPLHCAVRDGDTDAVRAYFATGGDAELQDNWGRTALSWAVQQGRDEMALALLELGSNPNTRDEAGTFPFYRAVTGERYDLARAIAGGGADVDAMNGDGDVQTALHYCVMQNRRECVELLLSLGADRTLRDSYGYTPLERVEHHHHIDDELGDLLRQ